MIVIISDNNKENIGSKLYKYYKNIYDDVKFVSASDRNIKPCYGCNGCVDISYGKCVFRDEMDQILPIIIKGDIVIYTSPLMWGGFSYDIKKIVDKMALVGNRFYQVKNKELVKGTIANMKKIVGIGVSDKLYEAEQSVFENLIRETGIIMNIKSMGKSVNSVLSDDEIEKLAMEVASQ